MKLKNFWDMIFFRIYSFIICLCLFLNKDMSSFLYLKKLNNLKLV